MDDLLALIDRVRLAGTPVDLTVIGDPTPCADVVHRVVQETLTNAMRHAPGSHVVVSVNSDGNGTRVTISDDGPGPGRTTPRGYGLVGLAERVDFAGGSFESGPGPHGHGFRVSATIPHAPAMSPS